MMVYFMNAWGKNGFVISSEDKTFYIYTENVIITIPTETINYEIVVNEKTTLSGSIKFETENEIVIKEKIVYIR